MIRSFAEFQTSSYEETIDLIYHTNTFHIGNLVVFRELPQILPPERLASIKSLELNWDLSPTCSDEIDRASLEVAVATLITSFPSMKKLYITVTPLDYLGRISSRNEFPVWNVLAPFDEVAGKLGHQLSDFHVAVPCRNFLTLLQQSLPIIDRSKRAEPEWRSPVRFWRQTIEDKELGQALGMGYWVCSGVS